MDNWEVSLVNETRSLVHLPPHESNILDDRPNEDNDRVWLAAQESLITFNLTNEAKNTKQRLDTLTWEIIRYNDASHIDVGVQYHAS